jgi:hypothetical protein
MHATIDTPDQKASASFDLEAEVEAWRSKRLRRPVSMSGKVTVVRIRRRAGPSFMSRRLADRLPATSA